MPEEGEEKPRVRVNFTPDALKRFLRAEVKSGADLYADVSRHSREYQDALGLAEEDIELLERRQGHLGMYPTGEDYLDKALLKIETDGKRFSVFATHTACHDYGEEEGWRYLLMAVSGDHKLNKDTGHGTTWINVVPEEWHKKLLEAIKSSAENQDLPGELFGFLRK